MVRFDATDVVAGTGIRVRDENVIFVSSGSTVDRLCSHATDGLVVVSNSLVCLLAAIDASLAALRKSAFEVQWQIGKLERERSAYRNVRFAAYVRRAVLPFAA